MLIGAAVLGAFAASVWLRRGNAGAKGLMFMLAAGIWYMVTYALELSSGGLGSKQLWGDVKYLGIALLPPAWLAFTLQYTGRTRWLRRRLFILLCVEPMVVLLLLSIPGTHDLVHVYPVTTPAEQFPIVKLGPVGWLNVFYSYAVVIFSTGLFVRTLAAIALPYRKQARALMVALLVPFVFNVLYNFNIGPDGRLANGKELDPGRWHNLQFDWDCGKGECGITENGRPLAVLRLTRETIAGVSYLRLVSTADDTDKEGLLLGSISADVSESWPK